MKRFSGILLLLFCSFFSHGETIRGEVIDLTERTILTFVNIQNIHVGISTSTDDSGRFSIAATAGQLIEFRKLGYKTVRFRVPPGKLPEYFKITMQQGPIELPETEVAGGIRNYKKDSIRYHELYKNALEFPELTGLDVIRHPFSALSKRNRQIWAFQKEYNYFEQEKYVDYTFNENLVTNLTGLSGDSAAVYLKKYRPPYEMLRSMNEYTFYTFIKQTVELFRSGRVFNRGSNRSAR